MFQCVLPGQTQSVSQDLRNLELLKQNRFDGEREKARVVCRHLYNLEAFDVSSTNKH
jgi:hypothetical protein